jgi:hypothetical protein
VVVVMWCLSRAAGIWVVGFGNLRGRLLWTPTCVGRSVLFVASSPIGLPFSILEIWPSIILPPLYNPADVLKGQRPIRVAQMWAHPPFVFGFALAAPDNDNDNDSERLPAGRGAALCAFFSVELLVCTVIGGPMAMASRRGYLMMNRTTTLSRTWQTRTLLSLEPPLTPWSLCITSTGGGMLIVEEVQNKYHARIRLPPLSVCHPQTLSLNDGLLIIIFSSSRSTRLLAPSIRHHPTRPLS